MSLRKIAKELGVSHTLLVLWRQGKRKLAPEIEARYHELVTSGYKNTPPEPVNNVQEVQNPALVYQSIDWREREGVEPTAPTAGLLPTELKSAKPTRAHPLPRCC